MRQLFPGHYRPNDESLSKAWSQGIIVPDANVLLDLYRYPEVTSREILAAFEKVAARLWLPHQIALEYHWNRDFVILEQALRYEKTIASLNSMLQKVEAEIGENRHAFIDGPGIVTAFARARDECVAKIRDAEKRQLDIGGGDSTTETLERLFKGKIGSAPNAEQLRKLHEEGEKRFARFQPPGYLDQKKKGRKSDQDPDAHLHRGLEHKRKFGDWIAWSQLLEEVRSKSIKSVLWITGETGDDWWHNVGHLKTGPRPELVEEIRDCGVEVLCMYSIRSFLENAKRRLAATVSAESLERVQEVNDARAEIGEAEEFASNLQLGIDRSIAVARWVKTKFPGTIVRLMRDRLLVYDQGKRVAFRIVDCSRVAYMDGLIRALQTLAVAGEVRKFVVCVFSSFEDCDKDGHRILGMVRARGDVELYVGFVSPSQQTFVSVISFAPDTVPR